MEKMPKTPSVLIRSTSGCEKATPSKPLYSFFLSTIYKPSAREKRGASSDFLINDNLSLSVQLNVWYFKNFSLTIISPLHYVITSQKVGLRDSNYSQRLFKFEIMSKPCIMETDCKNLTVRLHYKFTNYHKTSVEIYKLLNSVSFFPCLRLSLPPPSHFVKCIHFIN